MPFILTFIRLTFAQFQFIILRYFKQNERSKYGKYKIGDYVKVKHHNKDINIVEETREDYIPMDIKDLLDNESEGVLNTKTFDSNFSIIGGSKETIIIDGVEYVRK